MWTYEEGKEKISGATSRVLHSFPDTGGSPLNKVLLFLRFQEALSRIGAKGSKIKGPEIKATLNGAQINPYKNQREFHFTKRQFPIIRYSVPYTTTWEITAIWLA